MARRSPVADAARTAAKAPGRLRTVLVAVSWWAGWAGLVALAAVGVLALVPEDARPLPLPDDDLPTAAVAALAVASLLGWGCMQQGAARLRGVAGRPMALLLLVVAPLALTLLGFADERAWVELETWPRGDLLLRLIRWVPPALVTLNLLAFLTWRARPRGRIRWGRGAWWALLVLPYAALFALVALRVPAPAGVGEGVTDSLASLGRGSLAVQLAIAYFLGDSASG